jgi:hypothetical protein
MPTRLVGIFTRGISQPSKYFRPDLIAKFASLIYCNLIAKSGILRMLDVSHRQIRPKLHKQAGELIIPQNQHRNRQGKGTAMKPVWGIVGVLLALTLFLGLAD